MRFVSILLLILTLASCSKDDAPPAPTPLDKAKEVTAFSLKRANGTPFSASEYQVQIKTDTVSVTVPAGTDLNGLIPEITITGKTISPASGVAQNFNFPVVYTVTAEDGSQAKYTVIIRAQVPAGIVYFGSSDNSFYAVDALTGKVVWRHIGTQSFVYSSPTYANGTIYVGSIDNYVYAFDAATGVVKWKYLMGTTGIESDAVVFDGTVYVGCNDDFIVALDATTGAFKWKFTSGANISASPTVYNGVVYFGSSDGKLYALNASNGDLKWSFQTGAMINQSGPALVNGVVYVGSRDAHLYAINATTGAQIWRYSTNG
ncbi:MAG TPA: PQQ-binding-like beta-propeller repeat protein, partial [Chitinophagaceae bacterium]